MTIRINSNLNGFRGETTIAVASPTLPSQVPDRSLDDFQRDPGGQSVAAKRHVRTTAHRLVSIDVIRGVACLAVIFLHVYNFSGVNSRPSPWRYLFVPCSFGGVGVTVFIVVSGFCIHLGAARVFRLNRNARSSWVSFWKRRFVRLYPPYLAAIALSLAVFALVRASSRIQGFYEITSLPWDIASHVALVHNLFAGFNQGLFNGPFWSLGLEEQLYALYMVFLVSRRYLGPWLVAAIIFLISQTWNLAIQASSVQLFLQGLGPSEPLSLGCWGSWPFSYWFIWVLGAIAAEGYVGTIVLPRWACRPSAAAAFGAAWLLLSILERGLSGPDVESLSSAARRALTCALAFRQAMAGMATFCLINWCCHFRITPGNERGVLKFLAYVGLISYSLYLTHVPILLLGEAFLGLGSDWTGIVLRFAIYPLLSLAFGCLFYFVVERRFLHAAKPRLA
jgi:peptidoglycan/LPS O-acetylase OafA/YrhL